MNRYYTHKEIEKSNSSEYDEEVIKEMWGVCKEMCKMAHQKNYTPIIAFAILALVLGIFWLFTQNDIAPTNQTNYGEQTMSNSPNGVQVQGDFTQQNITTDSKVPELSYSVVSQKNDEVTFAVRIDLPYGTATTLEEGREVISNIIYNFDGNCKYTANNKITSDIAGKNYIEFGLICALETPIVDDGALLQYSYQ